MSLTSFASRLKTWSQLHLSVSWSVFPACAHRRAVCQVDRGAWHPHELS